MIYSIIYLIDLDLKNGGIIIKKEISFVIVMLLCLGLFFSGCSQNTAKDDNTQSKFCRVLCLTDDGNIVWIEGIEHVYVKNVDTALKIAPLDTVVMEFSESDLETASEKFTDHFGEELSYSYILEDPKSIRLTTAEEPTFG